MVAMTLQRNLAMARALSYLASRRAASAHRRPPLLLNLPMTSKPDDTASAQLTTSAPALRPLYEQSSQYRHWRFSKGKLAKMRAELNERAVKVVKRNVEAEKVPSGPYPPFGRSYRAHVDLARFGQAAAASLPQVEGGDKKNPIDLSTVPYLTVEDEQSLVAYYVSTVARTCAGFGFPEVIEATTISYLKRFYIWNTCMDYHPRKIMSVAAPLLPVLDLTPCRSLNQAHMSLSRAQDGEPPCPHRHLHLSLSTLR